MSGVINIATAAAISAGKNILQGFSQLDRVKIVEKSKNNYISSVDSSSERIIIEEIEKNFPEHAIISEEFGVKSGEEYTWVIDPLDGTNNFINNFPHFCVSIGVMQSNDVIHGVIYDPLKNELFTASKGQGAKLNNQRLRVNRKHNIKGAIVASGVQTDEDNQATTYLSNLSALINHSVIVRHTGSSALDLAYVAAGRLDGFCKKHLKVWDCAAGILMVKESGGIICDFSGNQTMVGRGEIIAGDFKIAKAIASIVA